MCLPCDLCGHARETKIAIHAQGRFTRHTRVLEVHTLCNDCCTRLHLERPRWPCAQCQEILTSPDAPVRVMGQITLARDEDRALLSPRLLSNDSATEMEVRQHADEGDVLKAHFVDANAVSVDGGGGPRVSVFALTLRPPLPREQQPQRQRSRYQTTEAEAAQYSPTGTPPTDQQNENAASAPMPMEEEPTPSVNAPDDTVLPINARQDGFIGSERLEQRERSPIHAPRPRPSHGQTPSAMPPLVPAATANDELSRLMEDISLAEARLRSLSLREQVAAAEQRLRSAETSRELRAQTDLELAHLEQRELLEARWNRFEAQQLESERRRAQVSRSSVGDTFDEIQQRRRAMMATATMMLPSSVTGRLPGMHGVREQNDERVERHQNRFPQPRPPSFPLQDNAIYVNTDDDDDVAANVRSRRA